MDEPQITDTLTQRGSRYGPFKGHAEITQSLKDVAHRSPNWPNLSADKREAVEMIFHKIGRFLNQDSDPEYRDNWHDIIGYAKLVEDTLPEEKE